MSQQDSLDINRELLPRFDQEFEGPSSQLGTTAEATSNFDHWLEREKKRLWLGYFSIKI